MATVIRTVLGKDAAIELVYTTSTGEYIGRIRVEAIGEPAMKVMGEDFLEFLAEQRAEAEKPRIAMAVGAAMNGRN
jgi:hypothetical protein